MFSHPLKVSVAVSRLTSEDVYWSIFRFQILYSNRKLEQWYYIKFCQNFGDIQVETIRKIQGALGDDSMSTARKIGWYNLFKDDRTSMDSDSRLGMPKEAEMTISLSKYGL